MRILIIKTSSLGDIIHALPVLDYLHQAAPDAVIDWVVDDGFRALLEGNPLLGRLLTVPLRRLKRTPFSSSVTGDIVRFARELRQERYDLVFDLQGNSKSGLICLLARAGRKVGFSREHLQERVNAWCTDQQVPFLPDDRNAAQRYLRVVAAPFGLAPESREWRAEIATSPADDAYAAQALAEAGHPAVLLHSGTTWQTKLWHEQGWCEFGLALRERYPAATFHLSWGDEEERRRATAIAAQLGESARLLKRMTLTQFVAVMKRMQLVVGGDTGPIHLAAAVGTATLSFYRCTDGMRNGPYGSRHRIVQSPLSCTVCMRKACERDDACRRSITVADMTQAAVEIFAQQGLVPGGDVR